MYPHERSLVKRMQGKPFVLIGVNTDPRERARSVIQREQFDWPMWWDGGNTSGPIATMWNNRGWPTFHVIDHKGVIRYKAINGATMHEQIEGILKEIELERAAGR